MIMIVITIMTEPNKLRNAPSVFVVTNIPTMTDLLLARTFFERIIFKDFLFEEYDLSEEFVTLDFWSKPLCSN